MRVGLAATQLHHQDGAGALFRWLRASEAGVRELCVGLHAAGRPHDAIVRANMLVGYAPLRRCPYGREVGLMKLVAEVGGVDEAERTLGGAIYLIDPVDPSSVFPEAAALDRQCVIHAKPFISTVASARDWVQTERLDAGLAPDPAADDLFASPTRTLALVAHDAMKPQMLAYAATHFGLLWRVARRVATGTTGQRLNELAWSRGWPRRVSRGCTAISVARWAGTRGLPTWCWSAAASGQSSSRTRMWRASTKRTYRCWTAR